MRAPHEEAGFSLLETLIAMAIIGVGVVAVLGALHVGIVTALDQRTLATADLTMLGFAEHVKAEEPYVGCDEEDDVDYGAGFEAPIGTGFVVEVTDVAHWDGGIEDPGFGACPAGGDQGVQRLELQITAETADGRAIERESLTIFKRRGG